VRHGQRDVGRARPNPRDGYQIEIVWNGTGDSLELTLPGAPSNCKAVWEGTPWVRLP
jgi:hypothetical protein